MVCVTFFHPTRVSVWCGVCCVCVVCVCVVCVWCVYIVTRVRVRYRHVEVIVYCLRIV